MRFLAISFCILSPLACQAEEEDWSKLYACFGANLSAMDEAEPSMKVGADLLIDAICNAQAADLANQMLLTRKEVVDQKGAGVAFSDFLFVMKREAAVLLFKARRSRLGI